MLVIAYDGLEYNLVEKYDCKNLKQKNYGKIDISKFEEILTPAIFSTLFTGHYPDETGVGYTWKEAPVDLENSYQSTGFKTLFEKIDKSRVISAPKLTFDKPREKRKGESKSKSMYELWVDTKEEKYYQRKKDSALKCFNRHFEELLFCIEQPFNLVFMWDHLADTLQHFKVGVDEEMKWLYKFLDKKTGILKDKLDSQTLLVMSDHGGEPYKSTILGSHSDHAFWSLNKGELDNPDMVSLHHWILNKFE